MSYSYPEQKQRLFTEDGQRLFIAMRDRVKEMLSQAGAFRMVEAMKLPPGVGAADSWLQLACIDRMVELGEIVELPRNCWAQYKVYTTPEVHNR